MSSWQLFLKGLQGETHVLPFSCPFEELYVRDVMRIVHSKTGIPLEEQRLIHSGKQLEKDKPLTSYRKMGKDSTIFLVLRLPGGALFSHQERNTPTGLPWSHSTPCMICFCHPNDDDDEPHPERRIPLLMPCKGSVKHTAMHPHCLMMYAHNEVFDNTKEAICCPQCNTEWTLDVIETYGVASNKEIEILSETLSLNVIRNDSNVLECPGCTSFCQRINKSDIRVRCRICEKKGKHCEFCWHCMREWKGSSTTNCSNPECSSSGILTQIQAAPDKEVVGVKCPSIRLCPDCGTAIEHKEACKHMTCLKCRCDFCFICLRQKRDGSWQCGSYNTKCNPAPRQERVPVKA